MARVHAGQADHSVPFWLYNLPSNLFKLNERQTITVVFLEQNLGLKSFLQPSRVHGHRVWPSKQQESLPLFPYNL